LFEDFVLDTDRRELRRGPALLPAEAQVFDLLVFLVSNRDRVISKDDLLASVWGGRIVSESTLASRINAARRVLGDNGEQQRLIRTIIGKGIRFVGTVRVTDIEGTKVSADERATDPALPDKPSIAVLPFANLSGDPDQDHFAYGMAEDIITALSRYPTLFVIARGSSFAHDGHGVDITLVGGKLGVRYVLDGSVRKGADRIRVTARLVEAAAGKQVWAERYDRETADIFALQDEITEAITTAIAPAIGDVERRIAMRKPPSSLDAWGAYQRGLWHVSKFSKEDNALAQECFRQAIALDPNFPGGYRGLAVALIQAAGGYLASGQEELGKEAEALARRAVELDGSDAESRAYHSNALWSCRDYDNALAEAKRL
jgi:TolB-like protein